MRTVRRDGLSRVLVATVAWAVCAVLFRTSPAGGGANIGAGIVALAAVGLSVAASRHLAAGGVASTAQPGPLRGRGRRQQARSVGMSAARCSVLGWAALAVLVVAAPPVPPGVVTAVWAVDLLLFLASSAVVLATT